MNLIYLNSGDGSVIEAQVFTLLEHYIKTNRFSDIVLLQGYKSNQEKSILVNKLKNYSFKVVWFRAWPNYTWFDSFNIFELKRILKKSYPLNDTIIHVRGDKFGALVKKSIVGNLKLLVDIRGAIVEEIMEYGNSKKLLKKNKIRSAKLSYRALTHNTHITAISESLKSYLVNQHNFDPEFVYVNPNIAGHQFAFDPVKRQIIRAQLNISPTELVAVFLSSDLPWQKDHVTIESLLKLNIRVIFLSPKVFEKPGVINRKVAFLEVPDYLSCADIAILWRNNDLINKVASPSKLSEFACNGLWIIHNGTVDIASDYINKTGLGIIVQKIDHLNHDTLSTIKNINRIKASIIGQKFFGIDTICSNYVMLYQKILST